MAEQGVDADRGFDTLRRASQQLNVELRDLAGRRRRLGARARPPPPNAEGDKPEG